MQLYSFFNGFRYNLAEAQKAVRISKEETLLLLRAYRQHPTRWRDVLEDIRGNVDQLPESARELYRTATNKQLQERLSTKFGKLMATRTDTIQDMDIRNALELVLQNERRMVDTGTRRHRRAEPVNHDAQPNEQPMENQQPAAPQDHRDPEPVVRRDQHGPEPADAQDGRAAGIDRHVAGPGDARLVGQQDRHVAGPRDARPAGQQDRHVAGPLDVRPAGQQDRHVAGLPAAGPAVPRDRRDAAAALLADSDSDHENAGQAPRRPKRRLVDVMKENHELYNKFMKTKMPKILRELGISSDSE